VDKVEISKEFCIKIYLTMKSVHSQRQQECIIHTSNWDLLQE